MPTACTEPASLTVSIDRKSLIRALDRARLVVLPRCPKPILTCVRLEASQGLVHVQATDCELSLCTQIHAQGDLPPMVVPCQDLLRRLKASKEPECSLSCSKDGQQLILSDGRVEHALRALDPDDFPPVPTALKGTRIRVDAQDLVYGQKVADRAMANEPSRYAIAGALLESKDDGKRLVATDGRRMVIVELPDATGPSVSAVLPRRFCHVVCRLALKEPGQLVLAVKREKPLKDDTPPARVYASGPDWLLSSLECEGQFPRYRQIMPRSHSKFAVPREVFSEGLQGVALTASQDSRAVRLDLSPQCVRLSANASGVARSQAEVPADFQGGGDPVIHTAFNPAYLQDALKTLQGDTVIIDVDQNGIGCDGKVFGKPVLLYAQQDPIAKWVIMPVSADLKPNRENLGSNYLEESEKKA